MRVVVLCLLFALVLAGCARAVIRDLEEDKVIVNANDEALAHAEAERGCAVHGRKPVYISESCLENSCTARRYLFACKL